MSARQACVYIIASRPRGTLYVGVTSDLLQRAWQHRHGLVAGFTTRHAVHTLVWHEPHADMHSAITREKALKNWKRVWKLELVETANPKWRDLYSDIL